jgi:hypothetical protein
MSAIVFQDGPCDGAVVSGDFGRSIIVQGEDHDRPGEVARYRRTNQTTPGGKKVYAFTGWDRVVLTIPVAPREERAE